MNCIVSYIQTNTSGVREKDPNYSHTYDFYQTRLDSIKDQLFVETLEFIKTLPNPPLWVTIQEGFMLCRDLYCYLKIRMKIRSDFNVSACIVRIKDLDTRPHFDPFPCVENHFEPVLYDGWNVICEDVHYTSNSFPEVYHSFLCGIEPKSLPLDTGYAF